MVDSDVNNNNYCGRYEGNGYNNICFFEDIDLNKVKINKINIWYCREKRGYSCGVFGFK